MSDRVRTSWVLIERPTEEVVGSLYVQLLVGVKGRGHSRTGVRQVGLSESSSNGGGVQPRAMARFKLMSHP
jgi:hypothetical protein